MREWHQRGPDAAHNRKPVRTPMRVIRWRRLRRKVHRFLRREIEREPANTT